MDELTITLPLDVVGRVAEALDRYVESEGTYGLLPGDLDSLTLVQSEVEHVKEMARG